MSRSPATTSPCSAVAVAPRPAMPLDIWLGGSAPAAFRRIGRLGDGWLGSFLTPDEARAGREQIQRAADAAGREIEPDHFGINLAVGDGELPDGWSPRSAPSARHRPRGARRAPIGHSFTASSTSTSRPGLTKFVIRPAGQASTGDFIDRFVAELLPRQN